MAFGNSPPWGNVNWDNQERLGDVVTPHLPRFCRDTRLIFATPKLRPRLSGYSARLAERESELSVVSLEFLRSQRLGSAWLSRCRILDSAVLSRALSCLGSVRYSFVCITR